MPPQLARGRLGRPDSLTLLFAFVVLAESVVCAPLARAQLTWDIHTADPVQNSGWTTALRLTAAGLPRVAEWAPGTGVRYAFYDGTSWSVETLPPPSAPAAIETTAPMARARSDAPARIDLLITTATALALDGSEDPWVVSAVTDQLNYDPGPRPLRAAHRVGGVWSTENLDPGFGQPSVEVGGSGKPQMCFDAGTPVVTQGLDYAVRDAGVWSYETVDVHGSSGILKLDGQGVPHIVYWDGARAALVHAIRVGPAAWDTTTVPAPAPLGSYAFALGSDGRARVAVTSLHSAPPDQKALRYLEQQPDGSWTMDVADASPGDKVEPSLALDPAGDPVIAYNDQGALDLKVAYRKGGAWTSQIVDGAGNTGYYASLAVDSHARPVVSFQTDAGPVETRVAFGSSTVGVGPGASPEALRLVALRPNPARAGAPLALTFTLPADARVSLEAFDASGRLVAARAPQALATGVATLTWDAAPRAPGLYFVRASANGWQAIAKLAVTR